jgi:hypothetical protein
MTAPWILQKNTLDILKKHLGFFKKTPWKKHPGVRIDTPHCNTLYVLCVYIIPT